ncbi:unnamed protein product [Discula destructiva]
MGVIDRIHSRIEIWRLERRYTRHRERRSTFVSNALYVDGEYVYQTPNTTGSSYNSASNGDASPNSNNNHNDNNTYDSSAFAPAPVDNKQRKKLNRFSSMPGFGSSASRDVVAPAPDWRDQRNSFDGGR